MSLPLTFVRLCSWWANSELVGFGTADGQPFDEDLADGLARSTAFVALLSQDGLGRLARLTAASHCDMVVVRQPARCPAQLTGAD